MKDNKVTLTLDRDVAERMQKFLSAFVEEDNQMILDIDSLQMNLFDSIRNKDQEDVIPKLSESEITQMKPGEGMDWFIHKLRFPSTWKEIPLYSYSLEAKTDWILLLEEFPHRETNFSLERMKEGTWVCRLSSKKYFKNDFYFLQEEKNISEAVCKIFLKYKMETL